MWDPPIGSEQVFALLFFEKIGVLMGANERSDQVTPKSIPLCGGPTVKKSLNSTPPCFFKLTVNSSLWSFYHYPPDGQNPSVLSLLFLKGSFHLCPIVLDVLPLTPDGQKSSILYPPPLFFGVDV